MDSSTALTGNFSAFGSISQLFDDQSEILHMISKGEDLPKILTKIVDWVERHGQGSLASILLVDDSGKHLLHGAAQSLPTAYNEAINGITIGQNVGSCGTAAHTKKQVIVEDIENNPLWKDFKHLALEHGLRACWSSPLLSREGDTLGTFAIYYKQPQAPTPQDLQFIQLVSQTAVVAIEFHKNKEERFSLLEREKASREKIEVERKRFYQILMDSPAMIAVLNGPQHVFEVINEMYDMAAGRGRKIVGLPITEALPEVVDQGIVAILDNVYNTGEPFYGNELLVKLDRGRAGVLEDRYFNFVYQPIRNEEGKTEGIFVHAIDVTDQVIARKAIEESEQRVRSIVENAPFPIGVYIGKEMRVVLANQSIIDVWGKGNDVIGKTYAEILPELANQSIYDQLDSVYTTGIAFHARNQRVDLVVDGMLQPFYFNYSFTPLYDTSGNIYGVMNTAAEITDLVMVQKKLAETQENLQDAVEVAELGTWTLDLNSNHVSCSSRTAEWFGLSSHTAHLSELISSIDSNDQKKVLASIEDATNKGSVYDVEYLVRNKLTGRERILHARGQVSSAPDGSPTFLTGIAQDVTLQKMAERELENQVLIRTQQLQQANMELQVANENLQQFAYVASHDLQEPLRKINLYSDLVSKSEKDNLSATGQSYLNKVSKSAERMSVLIKDLLALSRIEGKHKTFSSVDLNLLVNEIITDFEALIIEKKARIYVDSLCKVDAIPLQMNQLFYNLVGNALKFSKTDEAPLVRISSEILSPQHIQEIGGLNTAWQYCRISVADNGVGFAEEYTDQIFELFQRLHTRDEYEGTGVGLALCKRIVQNHNGAIFASSKVGIGATFEVILPVKRI